MEPIICPTCTDDATSYFKSSANQTLSKKQKLEGFCAQLDFLWISMAKNGCTSLNGKTCITTFGTT